MLLVLNVIIRREFRKIKRKLDLKIKVWWLKKSSQQVFVDLKVQEAHQKPTAILKKIASCIKRVAKDVHGKLRGGVPPFKDALQWNEEVKIAFKIKQMLT